MTETDDIFVPELAFLDFSKAWVPQSRKKHEKDHDRASFLRLVTGQEVYESLMEKLKDRDDRLRLGPWLDACFFKKLSQPEVETVNIKNDTPTPEQLAKDQPTNTSTAFAAIWDLWPKNERSGLRNNARTAFSEACREYGVETVVKVCSFYAEKFADPAQVMKHPNNLANFLRNDELFGEWKARAEFAPTPEDASSFEAVFSRYLKWPTKNAQTKRDDAFPFWLRHIKPEQRLHFYCSVVAYWHLKKDEVRENPGAALYTRNFITHVSEWLNYPGIDADDWMKATCRPMASALTYGVRCVFSEKGLGDVAVWRQQIGDADEDCGVWHELYRYLAYSLNNQPEPAIRFYLKLYPAIAGAEGRICPAIESLKTPEGVDVITTAIMAAARAYASCALGVVPPLPMRLLTMPPPDSAWVAAEKIKTAAKTAAAAEEKRLRHRRIVEEAPRNRRSAERVASERTMEIIDGLPSPYNTLALYVMTNLAWFTVGQRKLAPSHHPQSILALLISQAADDTRPGGYDTASYITALQSAAAAEPPDPISEPPAPSEYDADGNHIIKFELKLSTCNPELDMVPLPGSEPST